MRSLDRTAASESCDLVLHLVTFVLPSILGPMGAERTVLGDVQGIVVALVCSMLMAGVLAIFLYPCGWMLLENVLLMGMLASDTCCPGGKGLGNKRSG